MKALIVVTPTDYNRLVFAHTRQAHYIPADEIIFVGSNELNELIKAEKDGLLQTSPSDPLSDGFIQKVSFINEDDILPFADVHACIAKHMAPLLAGRELPRGITGWYYQQFLKMQFARITPDETYMVWDGDTVPCGEFSMHSDIGVPYLDVKQEYHQEYFDTIRTIFPGTEKVIGPSFISEHMLIFSNIMRDLMDTIEINNNLEGPTFWEKIIHAIPPEKIQNSSFSEFETYGTYVAFRHPTTYKLREWHSFRLAAEFFDPMTICERDYIWLRKSFEAISFEKNQYVREDHKNLFDNPEYQEKLSARKMLEVAQEAFSDGYMESWDILG